MPFTTHTAETAPAAARPILEGAKKNFGFIPNLLGTMAAAPPLLTAYTTVSGLFDQTSLSPTERQIVLLAVSAENGCEYCVAAHTAIAGMQKVSPDVVDALRNGTPIADRKLEALRRFAVATVKSRGFPGRFDTQAFFDAGYGETQVLEVILGVGMKILSNYTNHIARTPLDGAFVPVAWTKAA
jgi:uncharacterized peroxidase-related enzyme